MLANPCATSQNLRELTECWKTFLREWKQRFGFENCVYVDLANEYPCFINGHLDRTIADCKGRWSPEWNIYIRDEVNGCLRELIFRVSPLGSKRLTVSGYAE